MIHFVKKYLNWLQKDNPTGDIINYPELSETGETSVKGVYIVGDLTGIPLLKLAASGAYKLVNNFPNKESISKNQKMG